MLKRDKGTNLFPTNNIPLIFFTGSEQPDTATRPESDTGRIIFSHTVPRMVAQSELFFIFATQKRSCAMQDP